LCFRTSSFFTGYTGNTGRILFPGHDNNAMLKLMMDDVHWTSRWVRGSERCAACVWGGRPAVACPLSPLGMCMMMMMMDAEVNYLLFLWSWQGATAAVPGKELEGGEARRQARQATVDLTWA
jgi:hypothetical protein